MPKYILKENGKPKAVEAIAFKGILLDAHTGAPLINPAALEAQPDKAHIGELLAKIGTMHIADELGRSIGKSSDSSRFFEKRAERKRLFHDLSALLDEPGIRKVALPAPKAQGIVTLLYKINTHDYNFTPEEVEKLGADKMFGFLLKEGYSDLAVAVLHALPPQRIKELIARQTLGDALSSGHTHLARLIVKGDRTRAPGKHALAQGTSLDPYSNDPTQEALGHLARGVTHAYMRPKADDGNPATLLFPYFIDKFEEITPQQTAEFAKSIGWNDRELASFLDRRIEWKKLAHVREPIHDALLDAVPPQKGREYNREAWRDTLMEQMKKPLSADNPDLLPIIRLAPQVEMALELNGQLIRYTSPKAVYATARTLEYKNATIDPEWAAMCRKHLISQEGFERGLYARRHIAKEDCIPDIGVIDGEKIGLPGYYMRKLARDDPRILVVGRYADCCDTVDGGGYVMAAAHVTSPCSGVYALFRKGATPEEDVILAKTSVYTSPRKSNGHFDLCFNCWYWNNAANLASEDKISFADKLFLPQAALRAMRADARIDAIVGGGASNPGNFNVPDYIFFDGFDRVKPHVSITATHEGDGQYLIASRDRLEAIEAGRFAPPSTWELAVRMEAMTPPPKAAGRGA